MKNVLVQYQGGGYDGCFWEWNYFFFDSEGGFHDIFSSGRSGCDTEEKAMALFEEMAQVGEHEYSDTHCNSLYVYDVADQKAIEEFCRESSPPNVKGVLEWFDQNGIEVNFVEFFVPCPECGMKITDPDDLILTDWRGCGGIAVTANTLLCHECWDLGRCYNCDEYVGEDNLICLSDFEADDENKCKAAEDLEDEGYSYVCEDCLAYRAEQIEREIRDKLVWEAFTTGKPDLFSDEMRGFWNA